MAAIKQKCDFCDAAALYDGKTQMGPWAYMCEMHFKKYAVATPGLYTKLDSEPCAKKECTCCNRKLPITEFYSYTDHSGIKRLRPECKECNLKNRKK